MRLIADVGGLGSLQTSLPKNSFGPLTASFDPRDGHDRRCDERTRTDAAEGAASTPCEPVSVVRDLEKVATRLPLA